MARRATRVIAVPELSIPLMPSMLATFFSAQYWRMPSLPLRVDHWSMVGR